MTRSELTLLLAKRFPMLTAKDAEASVSTILDAVIETLVQGRRVEVRGFGAFALNYRPPRTGRNPKTGAKVAVPAKWVPCFKAGKEMRERVEAAAIPDKLKQVA